VPSSYLAHGRECNLSTIVRVEILQRVSLAPRSYIRGSLPEDSIKAEPMFAFASDGSGRTVSVTLSGTSERDRPALRSAAAAIKVTTARKCYWGTQKDQLWVEVALLQVAVFRVEAPSLVAVGNSSLAMLAFLVVFSVLTKLFICIAGS